MKYQILCIETCEFLHVRSVEVKQNWEDRVFTSHHIRYYNTTDIPKDVHSYSPAKIVTFLSYKKAEKWIREHCEITGLDKHLFEIVKADV